VGWLAAVDAGAALQIFTCETEWAALLSELAGERVEVFSATQANQDVHRVEARPALIARLRRADLLVCTGADLEAGWLPLLLRRANNPRVQPGSEGYFEASLVVPMLEVPQRLDRAEGDIHPYGNPHIHLDPRNVRRVAQALGDRLAALDPEHAAEYRQRLEGFLERWDTASVAWTQRSSALAGRPVVVDHRHWSYLIAWLGLDEIGALEPKPGLPPTAGHLAELARRLEERPTAVLLRAGFFDPRPGEWLAEKTGVPVLTLPYTVGADDGSADLFGLFDSILDRLSSAGAP